MNTWGVWSDRAGPESFEGGHTEEEAREAAARYNAEDPDEEAYAAEECHEHPDYQREHCQECNGEDEGDDSGDEDEDDSTCG